jgi:hypothetical protein
MPPARPKKSKDWRDTKVAGASISQSIQPTQRAVILYNTGAAVPTSVRNKTSLIIPGRTPSNPGVAEASAAGAIMLTYIDFVLYNTTGTYHSWFFGTSSGSPAISAYPGGGTSFGSPANLIALTDAQLRTKLDSTIRKMKSELPWMTGLFLDDCGPDWSGYDSLSATVKEQFYQKHVVMAIKIRELADELGLFLLTNGMWFAHTNHGYPTRSTQGCSLYDSVCIEHHDIGEAPFWDAVGAGQWRLRDPNGQRCMFHITNLASQPGGGGITTEAWRNRTHVAWIAQQTTPQYSSNPPPVATQLTPHDLGLSFGSAPTVTVTVTPNPVTVQTGTTQQFSATVSNGAAVTWSVNGVTSGNATVGTITSAGLYSAPNAAPPGGVVTVGARVASGESGGSSVTVSQSVPPAPPPSLPNPPTTSSKTFGNKFNGSLVNNMTPDYTRGVVVTAPENGTITKMWCAVDGLAGGTTDQPFSMRVYQMDSNGVPQALVASTSELTVTSTSTRTPNPEVFPFDPRHPVYQPVPGSPTLDAQSATVISTRPSDGTLMDTGSNSPPIYIGASTDPDWTVTIDGTDYTVKAPAGIAAGPGVDAPLVILDQESAQFDDYPIEYRMWQAIVTGSPTFTVTCTAGSVAPYNNDGRLYSDGAPALGRAQIDGVSTGSGNSYLVGMIRPFDMTQGVIRHAIRVAAGNSASTWVYPATKSDGVGTYPNAVKMGSRVFLPAGTDMTAINTAIDAYVDGGDPTIMNSLARTAAKMIATAVRDYGFIVLDSGGNNFTIYCEGNQTASWADYFGPLNPFGSWNHLGRCLRDCLPWDEMQVADTTNWAQVPSVATSPPTGQWFGANIATGSGVVTGDTDYLFVIHSGGTEATGRFYRNETAGVSRGQDDSYADGPASSLSGAASGNADISIFAEYTPTGTASANISGSVGISLNLAGQANNATAIEITNVMYINVPITRTYAIPYEDLGDGVQGRLLQWTGTQFEYDD